LYFNFFSASFCTTFLSAGIATSISVHVFSFLFLIIISGLFVVTSLCYYYYYYYYLHCHLVKAFLLTTDSTMANVVGISPVASLSYLQSLTCKQNIIYIFHWHSPIFAFSSYAISDLRGFNHVKFWNNNILETSVVFYLAGIKAQWAEGVRRILLGDNAGGPRGGGWSCCGQVSASLVEFGFQLYCLLYTYSGADKSLARPGR